MKSDFLIAITQLSAEKNLPREVVLGAVEAALVSAYRKDDFAPNQDITVKINPNTGNVKVWAEKSVVEVPSDGRREISLPEARLINPDVQIGEMVNVEATPHNAGRIAAQTAKQVILQRLHEAEHSAIFEEFIDKEGDMVTGVVQRIEPRQVSIDLGRTEAVLPAAEQMPTERYRLGQRLKVYLMEVMRSSRGPRIVVSRSHPDLLRRLFESEVPEVFNGIVELKAIAREAGFRSKVAVAARQEGIDPVGCCVGLRGIRIQNIVNELNGEKIDVVMWNPDAPIFITNALSPAQVLNVALDDEEDVATVVVPDKQLSLAIGKEGQNVRLAAKLSGWRIDIKCASEVEAERMAAAKAIAKTEEAAEVVEEIPAEMPDILEPALIAAETLEEATEEAIEEVAEVEPLPELDATSITPPVSLKPEVTLEKPQLRFVEDILPPRAASEVKPKKKKRKTRPADAEDGIRVKKRRRETEILMEDEELDEY